MRRLVLLTLSLVSSVPAAVTAQQPEWKPAAARLSTKWAKDVTPRNVWPEYPRPTLKRARWQNLNGLWEYAITAGDASMPATADGSILVPFPVESSLSGVGKPLAAEQRLWYRRTFRVPDEWRGERVLLHFGAVDWECEAFVDGTKVGAHRGGYDPFTFEITQAIAGRGAGADGAHEPHELKVMVRDPSDAGPQPRGKQVRKPHGIWYTPSSGIWQTVWLEPVPATWVRGFTYTADLRERIVRFDVAIDGALPGDRVRVRVDLGGGDTNAVSAAAGATLPLRTADLAFWTPAAPRLHAAAIEVERDGAVIDRADARFALRTTTVGKDADGITRLLLNGEPLFQFGPLDQGFWPDGLYTPPSFAAMVSDLDALAAMGCNMLRKHVKVESELFYAACDERGILVWQDMPSGDCAKDPANFERELRAMIAARRNHPSIVQWVVFNEGWGQHATPHYVELVRELDPTRVVSNASGWTDEKCGDVMDVHVYPGPAMAPPEPLRASVLGEYGGLGLPVAGHTWAEKDNWGYVSFRDRDELTREYVIRLVQLRPLIAQGLSAAVYTQTSDVEVEVNGWLTYDRAVAKIDTARASAATRRLYEPPGSLRVVLPTAKDTFAAKSEPPRWKYSFVAPMAGWEQMAFNDGVWQEGPAGFGTDGTPGAVVGTTWNGKEVWLRRTFVLAPDVAAALREPLWCVHHDEDVEVFFDGVLVLAKKGYTTDYLYVPATDADAKVLARPRPHVLAIRCTQTNGGQYVDFGIADLVPAAAR